MNALRAEGCHLIILAPGTIWLRVPDDVPDTVAACELCDGHCGRSAALWRRCCRTKCGARCRSAGGQPLAPWLAPAVQKMFVVSDPVQAWRERAVHFGATHVFSSDGDELKEGIGEITKGRGADLVLELAGVAGSVEAGLALVRTGGTMVLAGMVAPLGAVQFDPEKVVRRMLTIRGVHNYHPRDLATALIFLAGEGRTFPWRSLVAGEIRAGTSRTSFCRRSQPAGRPHRCGPRFMKPGRGRKQSTHQEECHDPQKESHDSRIR